MPEPSKEGLAELLKPIMALFVTRKERAASRKANTLRFWKSGMLKQLKLFADGKGTPKALAEVRLQLNESEKEVNEAIVKLTALRNEMEGNVPKILDDVLNNEGYGKSVIRDEISYFLTAGLGEEQQQTAARAICLRIEGLNGALDRLYRAVYEYR